MKGFDFRALDVAGKLHTGTISAYAEAQVVNVLHAKGLIPVEIVLSGESRGKKFVGRRSVRSKVPYGDLAAVTDQLATLLSAGLPLDRVLSITRDSSSNLALTRIFAEIYDLVRGGSALSDAMARHPQVFSAMYRSTVKAGETSGVLHLVLARLAVYLTRSTEFHRKVTNALIYPVILILAVAFALCFLLAFVVPQFAEMYANLHVDIPWFTAIVLDVGMAVRRSWLFLLALVAICLLALNFWLKRTSSKSWIQTRILRVPLLGPLLAKLEVERYLRTLSTLMSGGVHITMALQISRSVFENAWLEAHASLAEERVRRGIRFSDAWGDAVHFPKVALQIARVGEEAGQLDSMLLKGADMLAGEISTQLERSLAALVPVVTVLMFLVIGSVVMSILVPLYDLTSVIQ